MQFCLVLIFLSALSAGALEWRDIAGGRVAALPVNGEGKAGFTSLAPAQTGLHFTNTLPEARFRTNQILLNGSGVAAGDVDGDGWCDLYLCRLDGPNALYRNLGGWRFEDVTAASGVACPNMDASGATLADLEGDGDLDLLVNSVGQGTHIFLNDGKGKFAPAPYSPLNLRRGGTSLALADVDGDGYLDLYIANYRTSALMDMPNTDFRFRVVGGKREIATVNGRPVTDPEFANRFVLTPAGGIEELGEPDVFYRNTGGTNFSPVSFTSGAFLDAAGRALASTPLEWGLAAMFRDINSDGLPDLYVCNDFDSTDELWLNIGRGRFQSAPALTLRKNSLFSMAIDFADINRDGLDDFFVLDMLSRERVSRLTTAGDRKPPLALPGQIETQPQYMMNTLFLNRGDGTYAEIAQLSGVAASEWSWAVVFLDVDLDGFEDMLIANGHERASRHMDYIEQLRRYRTSRNLSAAEILEARNIFPRLAAANIAFRNQGDLTFADVGAEWGFDFVGVSNGMALADLDNDGDQDVIVNNLNDGVSVYRNNSPAPRLAVRLRGKAPNTQAVGARITISGGPVTQSQEMVCAGRYLSSDQPLRTFAAGAQSNTHSIRVKWRSGHETLIQNARPNHFYEIAEDEARPASAQLGPALPQPALFQDATSTLQHTHQEEVYNDFQRQPGLPRKLSQSGPGVAWCDFDGDGDDDLLIGTGRGGRFGVYQNAGDGSFRKAEQNESVTSDQTAVIGFATGPGARLALTGLANYENPSTNDVPWHQHDLANNRRTPSLAALPPHVGPLCAADIDADGDLDLFVGGHALPGKYPLAAPSFFLQRNGDAWAGDSVNEHRLGLVSAAVFSDFDSDGDPDLVLAGEWEAVRLLRNEKGRFEDVTRAFGLENYRGWWNGVATGDFDSDGKPDIVASNWGRNTPYQSQRARPLRLIYGDLDGGGSEDLVEVYHDPGLNKWVPFRGLDFMAKAMPFLRERFPTHQTYAQASIEEIFGERLRDARHLEANWLETTVFLNRGHRFEARALPVEAQMAPAWGIAVADFDNDGHDDIFLAQNFFATQPDTPRYDGGTGLLLRGDGQAGFKPVAPTASGIKVYGEQRGCAASDYDRDGRVDLAVTQNGSSTRLYRGVATPPGLRIRLTGGGQNPDVIGASLRAEKGGKFGPVREVQAGSGYLSQQSLAHVFAKPVERLWVRWPGPKEVEYAIPPEALELEIDASGAVRRTR